MRRLITVAFVFGCLTLSGRPSVAQDQPPPLPSTPFVAPALRAQHQPLSADQERELQQWVQDKAAWDHQQKRWQNGPAHNNYGKIVQRKSEPAPPAWLGLYCTSVVVTRSDAHAPTIERACAMLRQLSVDPQAEAIRQGTATVRVDQEKVHKTSFFSRVHLDGLWSTTSTDLRYTAWSAPTSASSTSDACSSSGRRESSCSGCRMLPGRTRFASAIRGA